MVINCEKCHAKFKLDDSRVTEKGVKVRCTKCKHVFKVYREENDSFAQEEVLTDFPTSDVQSEVTEPSAESKPFIEEPLAETSFDASAISFDSYDIDTDDSSVSSHSTVEPNIEPETKGGEVDFSSFDFGESSAEPDTAPVSTLSVDDFTDVKIEPPQAAPQKTTPQGLDFSDDDMFGAVVQAAPEAPVENISFDFGEDSFAESMEMGGQESGVKRGALFSLDSPADAPFSLGEIDFGDELTSVAVQQINPEDLKPSQESLFAPLAEAEDKSADDDLKRSFLGDDFTGAEQQELPPLSIASRRKQNPMTGTLIAVVVLLAISVLGYFGYNSFYGSKKSVAADAGKIVVVEDTVKAAYIENDEAGELLVISGEARNDYSKSRAALQVKVNVIDTTGQIIASKIAYGGNPLTDEQLESLPLEKIEAAMANQFGDSLANMDVAHGETIPFVVVLAKVPKGAKDFEVQSAGSTVASGKQGN